MYIIVFLCLLVSCVAFVPTTTRIMSNKLKMSDEMVGASVEINNGEVYDPLDLFKLHDVAPTVFPHAKWLREAEIKHCRIAMLASIGAFVPTDLGITFPGYTAGSTPVENLNQFVTNYPLAFAQIILSIGLIEGASFPGEFWFGKGDREPGDLGYDPIGARRKQTTAQAQKVQLQELKNGRLAMMAMAAYTSEHWIPGSVPVIPGHF